MEAQGLFKGVLEPAKLVPMDGFGPMFEALYNERWVLAPRPPGLCLMRDGRD